VPGWGEALDGCETVADLPDEARDYVQLVERELGVPVTLVGTGAAREQVLSAR
jgi:adenylosuccinate synthase